ncbi:hypothetical protein FQN50_009728 [Emmonsiellopsis sp. PD_5]|nr:hypothetical protein FQN50_009728 [Emmonsiellopsis sp. PD_5]
MNSANRREIGSAIAYFVIFRPKLKEMAEQHTFLLRGPKLPGRRMKEVPMPPCQNDGLSLKSSAGDYTTKDELQEIETSQI